MARTAWYKLDNIGKFYSSQAGSDAQTVFRISAQMSENVEPECLQAALDAAIEIFPGFNVTLKSGLFWHYLEQSNERPLVTEENLPVCYPLYQGPSSVLFRVNYWRKRINLEVSHIVSDGRGTLEFFKTLIGKYAEIKYGAQKAVVEYVGDESQKSEDSFSKNYERSLSASEESIKTYRLTGWKDIANPTYIEYHLSANAVAQIAKAIGVSVTSILIAAVIRAIMDCMPKTTNDLAIRLDVPVDLRRFFASATMRNFFGLAFVDYTPSSDCTERGFCSVQEIAKIVQGQITKATEPAALKKRMNRMVKLEKNPFIKIAPLFLKTPALRFGALMNERSVTTTLSSLGRIDLPESLAPYVDGINVITTTKKLNFVACSYKDDLSIGITTAFTRHDVIFRFAQVLRELGLTGYMNVNKDSFGVNEDLKNSALESRLLRAQNRINPEGDIPSIPNLSSVSSTLSIPSTSNTPSILSSSSEEDIRKQNTNQNAMHKATPTDEGTIKDSPGCLRYCEICDISFTGELDKCPLCGSTLDGADNPNYVPSAFPDVEYTKRSKRAGGVLSTITLAALIGAIILCIALSASWQAYLASTVAIAISYMFVRNAIRMTPDLMRITQRYYLVLVAICILWYFAADNPFVSTVVATYILPSLCMMGVAFEAVLLAYFGSRFLTDYSKYVLFALMLGFVPLVFLAAGATSLWVMPVLSAILTIMLIGGIVAFAYRRATDEAKRLFNT